MKRQCVFYNANPDSQPVIHGKRHKEITHIFTVDPDLNGGAPTLEVKVAGAWNFTLPEAKQLESFLSAYIRSRKGKVGAPR
jgi:hypothetical protein